MDVTGQEELHPLQLLVVEGEVIVEEMEAIPGVLEVVVGEQVVNGLPIHKAVFVWVGEGGHRAGLMVTVSGGHNVAT